MPSHSQMLENIGAKIELIAKFVYIITQKYAWTRIVITSKFLCLIRFIRFIRHFKSKRQVIQKKKKTRELEIQM